MYKAVATAAFAIVLLVVFTWYEPSREELAFSDVAVATVELGDALPPLPDGAHDLRTFGHQSRDSIHIRLEADPGEIEDWLQGAEQAKPMAAQHPLIVDSIQWWHPGLRMGGRADGSWGPLPPVYAAYGHWVAVDDATVYLWPR